MISYDAEQEIALLIEKLAAKLGATIPRNEAEWEALTDTARSYINRAWEAGFDEGQKNN